MLGLHGEGRLTLTLPFHASGVGVHALTEVRSLARDTDPGVIDALLTGSLKLSSCRAVTHSPPAFRIQSCQAVPGQSLQMLPGRTQLPPAELSLARGEQPSRVS
jgi:hypothetical protein